MMRSSEPSYRCTASGASAMCARRCKLPGSWASLLPPSKQPTLCGREGLSIRDAELRAGERLELPRRLAQVALADDRVAAVDGLGLVADHLHRYARGPPALDCGQ